MSSEADFGPEQLEELQEIFEAIVDLEPAERPNALGALQARNPALASRVSTLLKAHHRTTTPLDSPVVSAAAWEPYIDRRIGSRVGAFEILRKIGAGGMGTVYLGRRADHQFEMLVAIKFLTDNTGPEALQRFRDERQILASLGHPNIAALLDGGVTEQGEPYFVMEYVEGEPITQWADSRSVSISRRLDLFLQVCAAVQSAHHSLVVHRDLKPGNILVTTDGTVKLLDFGIARLLDTAKGSLATLTHAGRRPFTPDYASPEQLLGLPITTSSDVYSLGVVLYQLLTGNRPFSLEGKSAVEMERVITSNDPPRPSACLTRERAVDLSERSPERARARLAGDLDAVILKALRKEPERRYASVEELTADLRRHLRGHAVLARHDSASYRIGKMIRRNRGVVLAMAVAFTSLLGGLIATTRQTQRAVLARQRGEEVKSFLITMLGAAEPGRFGKDVAMRTVLDSAMIQIDQLSDPRLQSEIRGIVGGTWLSLGEYARAEEQYRLALATQLSLAPEGSREAASAMIRLVTALDAQGRSVEADSILTEVDQMYQRVGFIDETERANLLDLKGQVMVHLGRPDQAEAPFREVIRILKRASPPNDSMLSTAYGNLGVVIDELGDHLGAESLLIEAVNAARRAYGEMHPLVAAILSPLATTQEYAGHPAAADSTYQLALAMRSQLLGPEHPDYAWTLFNYADHLGRVGNPAEAARRAREVLKLHGRTLGNDHPTVAGAMRVLGKALTQLDSLGEAEHWLRESWRIRQNTLPKGHWLIASSESYLGEFLTLVGRYPEAEQHLMAGARDLAAARGEEAEATREARARLQQLYRVWQRP